MSHIPVKNYKGVEVKQVKNAPNTKNAELLLKDAIMDRVLEVNDFPVPQNLVDEEVTMIILEQNHRMKYESLASGGYVSFTQDEMTERVEKIKAEAFKLVKTRLVIKGIIAAENFEVTRQELEAEAQAIADRQQTPLGMVKDFLGEDLELLKDDLLVRKAVDFVIANAVIK